MLQGVVFLFEKDKNIDWEMRLAALRADLQRNRIDCVFGEIPIESRLPDNMPAKSGMLYLSDSAARCGELAKQQCCVLPCRHEGNRAEAFAGESYPYVAEKLEEMDAESLEMVYRRLAGLPWDILETKRCRLRETTAEDVDAFYQIYREPDITAYMEDLYEDRNEEIAYVQDYIRKVYGFYGYGMWTVLERESGLVIGRAGVSWREGFDLPELGFVIGVPWQRRGYAYEICSGILGYAKEELGMSRVQALVVKGNERSERLCRKLGFVKQREIDLEDGALPVTHSLFIWEAPEG